jgi:hypothetical protein
MVLTPIPDELSRPRQGRRCGNIITYQLFGKGFLQDFFLSGIDPVFRPLSGFIIIARVVFDLTTAGSFISLHYISQSQGRIAEGSLTNEASSENPVSH